MIPGWGRSPKEGSGNLLQYSCLGNPMDRGAWWATVHRVVKSQRPLSAYMRAHTHTHTHHSLSVVCLFTYHFIIILFVCHKYVISTRLTKEREEQELSLLC